MPVPAPKTIEDYVVGVLGYPSLGAYFSPSLNPGERNPGTALAEMAMKLVQEYVEHKQTRSTPNHDNS